LASSAPSFGGNQILPSFITRKETKPSSWLLQGLPLVTYPQKFKFGSYYLSFFEYGETSTVLASKKLWKESPFVFSTLPWSSGHKFSASPSFFSFAKVKKCQPPGLLPSRPARSPDQSPPTCLLILALIAGAIHLALNQSVMEIFVNKTGSRGSFESNRVPEALSSRIGSLR
jgi:hypothetical protein